MRVGSMYDSILDRRCHMVQAWSHTFVSPCRFMLDYHKDAELAPRDVVARAIQREMQMTGADHVWLDISHKQKSEVKNHFPNIYKECKGHGIDITSEPIPVAPAQHYMCGGVQVCVLSLWQ